MKGAKMAYDHAINTTQACVISFFEDSFKILKHSTTKSFARRLEKEFNYEISFFDCLHVVLARKEKAILITRDEKLIMFGSKYCKVSKPEKFL
jgi:predicted nucleic acid-binding protein